MRVVSFIGLEGRVDHLFQETFFSEASEPAWQSVMARVLK
jgi:hypothetical protein